MDELDYDRKKLVAIKPDVLTRGAWINHLCVIMPTFADRIRREAIENVGKNPKVYQTYVDDEWVGTIIEWEGE